MADSAIIIHPTSPNISLIRHRGQQIGLGNDVNLLLFVANQQGFIVAVDERRKGVDGVVQPDKLEGFIHHFAHLMIFHGWVLNEPVQHGESVRLPTI